MPALGGVLNTPSAALQKLEVTRPDDRPTIVGPVRGGGVDCRCVCWWSMRLCYGRRRVCEVIESAVCTGGGAGGARLR